MRLAAALTALYIPASLVGCGADGPPELAPVTGVVSIDGEPAAGVKVRFLPRRQEGDKPLATSEAITDELGRYELRYLDGDAPPMGAAVGDHYVLLTDFTSSNTRDESVAPNRISPKYSSAGRSPLKATVAPQPDGSTEPQNFDFEIDGF
ncbi:MAG: hypothetical protein AAF907_03980 [Planctomycetota bacterium]